MKRRNRFECLLQQLALAALMLSGLSAWAQQLTSDPWLVPFQASGRIRSSPAASPVELTVYFGDDNGVLYAVNPQMDSIDPRNLRPPTPQQKWRFLTDRGFYYSSPTVSTGGTVYAASSALYALNPRGELQWKFQFPNGAGASSNSSPAIGIDGVIYVASDDEKLFAVRDKGTSFDLLWPAPFSTTTNSPGAQSSFKNRIASSPSVATDGSIYFVTEQDILYALRPNGTEKWRKVLNSSGVNAQGELASSVAIGRDGTLYVGSKGSGLYALRDQGTNSLERWRFDPGDNAWFVSSPVVGINETIHVSSIDGRFFSLSNGLTNSVPLPGFPRFVEAQGKVVFSTAAVDRNGIAYVGTFGGQMFAIDPNGANATVSGFPYRSSDSPIRSSPTILSDGLKSILLFGSEDGYLYAAYTSGPLAPPNSAAWPMFRKDLSHSAVGSTAAPIIIRNPVNQNAIAGGRVEFSVVVSANPPPIYTWRKGGTPIPVSRNPTATSSTLVIPSANPSDAGTGLEGYDCLVSNSAGSVTSTRASLILSSAPEIVINPDSSTETFEDITADPIQFFVGDLETAAANLTLRVEAADKTLIPNSGIVTGIGAQDGSIRTVTITPATNQFGRTTLTAFIKDEDGVETSTTFNFLVRPQNDSPFFDPISDLVIPENSSRTITISNIISGPLNERDQFLIASATSDRPDLVINPLVTPNFLGTNQHEATLTLTTVPGANGDAKIRFTVFDSTATNLFAPGFSINFSREFKVTIGAINDPPIILFSTNKYFGKEDLALPLAGIRVSDPDAGSGNLTLTLRATNGVVVFGSDSGLNYQLGTSNRSSTIVVSGSLPSLNGALSTLNYFGAKDSTAPDRVTLIVNDQGNTGTGGAREDSKFFDISLEPVNDPPTISRIPAQTMAPNGSLNVRVQVTDVDTPLNLVTLVGSSSDSGVVLNPVVFRDGTDPSIWIVQLNSAARQDTASISLLASDGTASVSGSFVVTVQSTNTLPTISGIPPLIVFSEDGSTNLNFTVSDVETPASALSVQVSSSNPALFPASGLAISSLGGGSKLVTLSSLTNAFGDAVLTLVVGDGVAFVTNRVDVKVLPVNDLPTATQIADVSVALNATTNAVFRVADVETQPGAILVQVASSNPSVIASNPLVGVNGGDRSIRIAPAGLGTSLMTVLVSDADGGQITSTFRVTVVDPVPVIIQQPTNTTVIAGSSATFTVLAVGEPPLRYQWKFEGTDIPQATNSFLSLANVTPSMGGSYSVAVANGFGGKLSNPASLSVLTPPFIVSQPDSKTVRSGDQATFIALAEGTRPLAYQWLKNGIPIIGANNSSLILPSVSALDAGRYSLSVTNIAGAVVSREAVLALNTNTPPKISDITGPFQVPDGTTIGPLPFTVQDSETPSQLIVSGNSSNQDLISDSDISLTTAGFFRFVTIRPKPGKTGEARITLTVRDPDGATASDSFQVVIQTSNTAPVIQDVADIKADSGAAIPAVTFSIRDAESAAADLVVTGKSSNQQLMPDSGILVGGQGVFRTLTLRPQAGEVGTATITLTVSDGQLTASDSFVLTIVKPLLPPVFVSQLPTTITTNVGATVLLSAVVTGTDPLGFQWRFNTVPISGAVQSNLLLTNVQVGQSGSYSVAVSNAAGAITSSDVALTVLPEKTAPVVTLLQPTNNSTFTAGERIIFSASASDADGLVTRVRFFVGTNLIGEDPSSPYNTNTVISVPGTYEVTAVATDNEGFETSTPKSTIVVKPATNLPTISITDVPGEEGDSGFRNFVFRLSLSAPSDQTVKVRFSTASDTATAGKDFVETNGIVEFAPGVRTAAITVQVIGDTLPDGDNETFFVNLSDPLNALLADSQGIGTIVDDENPIFISVTDASVTEGNSSTNSLVFTVQLSEPSTQEVSVEYATANGTALAGVDYVNRAGRLVFPPNTTSLDVRVPVIPDLVQEPNRSMKLRLSNPANAILFPGEEEGIGTITDDDAPPTARVEDLTLAEGNAGITEANVVVNLTSASAQPVSVDFVTADGTAQAAKDDYSSLSGTLVFPPGVMTQTIKVQVKADTLHEPDEFFLVRLSNPTNTTLTKAEAVVKLLNDDLPPTLSIVGRNVIEGNSGTVDSVFTVQLSTPSGQSVTVDYGTRDVTATAGLDYQRVAGTLVFQPGETTKTITVPVIGDLIDEPRETFDVVLDNPLNATISEGVASGGILDDDAGPVIQIQDATVVEGATGTTNALFQVLLSSVSGQTVSVNYSTVEGTASPGLDYIVVNATLVFPPGVTNRVISIPVLGDILSESNETFQVKLTSPVNATVGRDTAPGTIIDDDAAPAIRVEDLQVEEGNAGVAVANVPVRLTSSSSQPITVAYQVEGITATAGEDFSVANGTITFEPGSSSKSIAIQIVGDTLDEPNETLKVKLSQAVNATIDRAEAIVTIIDDDLAPTLSVVGRNVIEGNTGFTNVTFTLTLSTGSGQPVSVNYATRDVTATAGVDYQETHGTVTFAPGDTVKTILVPVMGDLVDEPRETFQLVLSNPVNATVTEDTATGAILNDDVRPTLSVTDASVTEGIVGGAAVLQVTLSSPSGQTVTVQYSTRDGTAAAGSDYTASEGSLTFSPGEISKPIFVAILNDGIHEETETFSVVLAGAVNAGLSRSSAQITILDDDDLPSFPPTISAIPDQASIAGASVLVRFTLTDPDTPLAQVNVSVSAEDKALLGAGSMILDGQGTERTLLLQPTAGVTGVSTVTLKADDGKNTAARSFRLNVSNPNTPPSILTQPVGRTVLVGTSVSLGVSASGSPPLAYQWRFNGTNLAGATNSTLILDSVQTGQAGDYSVLVSNPAGRVPSSNATLVVGRLGAKLWDYQIGKPVRTSVAIGADGSLFIGADDGKIHSLTHDGVLRWTFGSGGEIYSSPAVGADGSVYFGSFDHKVYALNRDGSKRWEFATGAEIYSSPALGADGTVYVGSYDSRFYAINPDGTLKWEFLTGNTIASSACIGSDGTIYVGSQDRKLYALNPDGTKKWEFTTLGDIISSPSISREGNIYVGSLDRRLYALRPDGSLIWQFQAINAIRSSPSIGEDGTLYFGTDDGRLYAVGSDGRKKWDATTGVLIFSSPAIGIDGTIYVGSFDRKLYAFNPSGSKKWEFSTEGEVYSSPALDKDGVVYLGSLDGHVYAITGTTGLADTAWPMFRRKLDHTGLVPPAIVSVAPLLSLVSADGAGVRLRWNAETGKSYTIQASPDLQVWTDIAKVTASGAVAEATDPGPAQSIRFYRIVIR